MIPFQSWKFFDFVRENGNNPIQKWYEDQNEETRVFFDETLDDCRKKRDPDTWPRFKPMAGKDFRRFGIWQIGFKSERRQYRIWGVFDGGGSTNAVILGAGYHKESYEPRDILSQVCERAKQRDQGRGGIRERESKAI